MDNDTDKQAPAAVTLSQEQLAKLLNDAATAAASAAVTAFQSRSAPVTGPGVGGGRQVRLVQDIQPAHGDPVDRVGTVERVIGRVLHGGKEVELLAVRFPVLDADGKKTGEAVEERVASDLVGA